MQYELLYFVCGRVWNKVVFQALKRLLVMKTKAPVASDRGASDWLGCVMGSSLNPVRQYAYYIN